MRLVVIQFINHCSYSAFADIQYRAKIKWSASGYFHYDPKSMKGYLSSIIHPSIIYLPICLSTFVFINLTVNMYQYVYSHIYLHTDLFKYFLVF